MSPTPPYEKLAREAVYNSLESGDYEVAIVKFANEYEKVYGDFHFDRSTFFNICNQILNEDDNQVEWTEPEYGE
jgi:hypothetical protein